MKAKELIKQFNMNNPKKLVALILISFATIICTIALPVLLSFVIDNTITFKESLDLAILSDEKDKITLRCFFLLLAFILDSGLTFFLKIVLEKQISSYGSSITSLLENECYACYLRGELFEVNTMNDVNIEEAILSSCHTIGYKYYSDHVIRLLYSLSMVIGLTIFLSILDVAYGLICFVSCFALFGILKIFYALRKKTADDSIKKYQDLNDEIVYNSKNLKSIKIRNGVQKEIDEFASLSEKCKKPNSNLSVYKKLGGNMLVFLFAEIMVFVLAIFNVLGNEPFANLNVSALKSPISVLVACFLATYLLVSSFKDLFDFYLDKQSISAAYKQVNEILDMRPESRSENINSLDEIHTLSFNNVSFEYSAESAAGVEKINFELKKGEKLGILGYAKSGKTTIVDMISKIIRPRYGNILINNCDINKINTSYLRNIIAYVPQNFSLFDGTIEQNIVYPMDLDEYRYNDALNKCKLKTLLQNLPKRDQENVKDVKLSQVDVERIGLAYALYKDSPIIILDEATSKLDQVSEVEIMNEFYKLKNKMMIVVSNRISTLSKCDKIMILNEGKIVEYGKVDDLVNDKRSAYSRYLINGDKKAM